MDDLISRAAAIDAIDNERKLLIERGQYGAEHIVVHYARRQIEELPTVDVASVKHGKWIKVHGYATPGGDPVWACSERGKGTHVYGIEHGSYGSDIADGQWGFVSELWNSDDGGTRLNLQFQKVIEGLEHHVGNADCGCWRVEGNEINPACPYYNNEDNGEPACETKLLLDTIRVLKDQDDFCKWLAHLVVHEDSEGGAEAEIICRRLVEMGYVEVKDGYYMEVFSEDEDEDEDEDEQDA